MPFTFPASSRIHRHQLPRRLIIPRVLPHQRRELGFLLRRRDGSFETGEQFADRDAGGRDLGADFFARGEGDRLRLRFGGGWGGAAYEGWSFSYGCLLGA